MNNTDLTKIAKAHSNLTASGFDVDEPQTELLTLLNECNISCNWLALATRCKHPNRKIASSYGLKAKVERWSDSYISEGAFIAAAIHLGFKLSPKKGTTSTYLNISSRSNINGQWI